MAIGPVVTRGFSIGSIALVVLRGFIAGAAAQLVAPRERTAFMLPENVAPKFAAELVTAGILPEYVSHKFQRGR